jgi:hypothetical protein
MHVASLSPLSVGGLAWSSPEPCYTVVLKATFSLEGDGPLNLHLQQAPVSEEKPGKREGELFYGSDFAPRKVGVDLMLVGHARGRDTARVLPIRVALGELESQLYAVSDTPARKIPLSRARRRADDPKSAVQLAPRPTATRSWRHHLIASHFDFTAFNAADPEHRLDEMPLDAVLRLEGLSSSGEPLEVLIGDTQPYVFYVRDCHARDDADLLFPACDTVWIDTDRERLILTWRCEARPGSPSENPFLAVVLGTRRVPPDWSDVRRRLAHARWHEAVEPPSTGWALLEAGPWAAPAWPPAPPPAPSSHAQAIAPAEHRRTRDDWPAFIDDRPPMSVGDGPPTPRASAEGEPQSLDDGIDTPRTYDDGPPTPRSLDDDPLTPRSPASAPSPGDRGFTGIERTARLPDVEATARGLEDLDDTRRIVPEDSGPLTQRRPDPKELRAYLDDEEGTPPRRPTEPCPPPEEEPALDGGTGSPAPTDTSLRNRLRGSADG